MSNLYLQGLGHYSYLVDCKNGLYLLSGIKAWNLLENNKIKGCIEQQTKDICRGLDDILLSANLTKKNIARVQCFLTDLEEYDIFDRVYSQYMGDCRPARAVIGAAQLRFQAKVELVIDCYE